MPIRVRPGGQLLKACRTPTSRYLTNLSVPPRRRTPSHPALRTMSSTSNAGPATTGSRPAPATSTSPLPGNTSSASPGTPASGGAAPAPSSSPSHPPQPAVTVTVTDDSEPSTEPSDGAATNSSSSKPQDPTVKQAFPALPSPDSVTPTTSEEGTTTMQVNGQPIALDKLGPMVVGRDGTISRIANWQEMTDLERENTLRVLGKRNQLRLGNLRAGLPADHKPGR
ncbi:hypothetical protein N657DRAFT_649591 [Parathielavia appendiculata]|uniref:Uncharacterized protein n=1 Tax=Parathielavia appendiculata TaxID=2587402 RepID=A0AAN6TU23_9PEZI|nr:hypothetical protein N657DRAFT_649591 [Parathielavia appendiculata]